MSAGQQRRWHLIKHQLLILYPANSCVLTTLTLVIQHVQKQTSSPLGPHLNMSWTVEALTLVRALLYGQIGGIWLQTGKIPRYQSSAEQFHMLLTLMSFRHVTHRDPGCPPAKSCPQPSSPCSCHSVWPHVFSSHGIMRPFTPDQSHAEPDRP